MLICLVISVILNLINYKHTFNSLRTERRREGVDKEGEYRKEEISL